MYDFNSITIEIEKETVIKFKENGVGVQMGKYTLNTETSKWSDLIDPKLWSIKSIKSKMIEIAKRINTECNDELLGDMSVAFMFKTALDETVKYTYLEMYTFLRAALRYKITSKEFVKNKREIAYLEEFIEDNKSTEDKLKDAKAKLKKLLKQI
jgi:hypothetical protein